MHEPRVAGTPAFSIVHWHVGLNLYINHTLKGVMTNDFRWTHIVFNSWLIRLAVSALTSSFSLRTLENLVAFESIRDTFPDERIAAKEKYGISLSQDNYWFHMQKALKNNDGNFDLASDEFKKHLAVEYSRADES